MRKNREFLKKRDIADLVEALELIINEQLQRLRGLGSMLEELTDPVLIKKAYKEMGDIVQSLLPVQYLVEQQAPGMKDLFEIFKENVK